MSSLTGIVRNRGGRVGVQQTVVLRFRSHVESRQLAPAFWRRTLDVTSSCAVRPFYALPISLKPNPRCLLQIGEVSDSIQTA